MLKYNSIVLSEGIDVNKTNDLRDFHYRYFLEINFTSDPKVFDGCYDLMQLLLSKKVVAELRSSTWVKMKSYI